jgi:glyoxylase-like metal-dependent hydrolase (beta-lactamase superfamily II)
MPLSFTEISPSLWVAQSRSLKMNTGVFISEEVACLIDPGLFPDEIEDMARLVANHGARPAMIVLTHSHWDHIVGPEHFPGVKVIAQAKYLDFTRENSTELVKPLAMWEEHVGIKRDRPFVIPQPDETFEEEATVRVGKLTLRLVHVPGHAVDQLAVRHEETGAVWVSDILSDIEIPFVSDNLAAYERTLEMVETWDIRALVPGHGAATIDKEEIRKRIEQDKRYLAEVRKHVERALSEGRTMKEAVRLCDDMEIRYPDINGGSHVLNVESVYMELGGEGDLRKKGWAKDFFAQDE